MTIGAILLSAALLVAVVAFVARPFWMPESIPAETEMTRAEALEARKAVLLDRIRALDFDLETGKLPPGEHELQRGRLMAQAAEILKEIDSLGQGYGTGTTMPDKAAVPASTTAIVAEIEAAIVRIRESRTAPLPAVTERIAVAVPAGVARFCAECGSPRDADDKFCAFCGSRL